MRKLAFATAVFMACALTACGGASDTAGSGSSTSGSQPTSSDTSTVSTSDGSSSGSPSTPTTSGSTTGGGSDPGSAYCAELTSAKAQFKNLNLQVLDQAQFQKLTAEFDTLASAAPSDVQDDWIALSSALKNVQQILADAGLTFDDLKGLSAGQLPQGVSLQEIKKVGKKLAQFGQNSQFQDAAKHISAEAKAVCGFTLGN